MRFIARTVAVYRAPRKALDEAQPASSVSNGVDGGLEAGAVFEGEVTVGAGDGLAADVSDEVASEGGPLALELVACSRQLFDEAFGDGEVFPALGAVRGFLSGASAGDGEGVV